MYNILQVSKTCMNTIKTLPAFDLFWQNFIILSCKNNEAFLKLSNKNSITVWAKTAKRVCLTFNYFPQANCQHPAVEHMITGVHLSVLSGGSFWYYALHLQELVGFVTSYNCEAKSHIALLQGRWQEGALQLGRVPRKQRLLCRGERVSREIFQTSKFFTNIVPLVVKFPPQLTCYIHWINPPFLPFFPHTHPTEKANGSPWNVNIL